MWFRDFNKSKPGCFAVRVLIGPAFSSGAAGAYRERRKSANGQKATFRVGPRVRFTSKADIPSL
jgi:hypothetical protein